MKLPLRRILLDLLFVGLLIAANSVIDELIPPTASIFLNLGIPVVVIGFGRGFAERRFLASTSYWIGGVEWLFMLLIADITLCYVHVVLRPYENFQTVFGLGLILLIPSLALGGTSYWVGASAATRASRKDT